MRCIPSRDRCGSRSRAPVVPARRSCPGHRPRGRHRRRRSGQGPHGVPDRPLQDGTEQVPQALARPGRRRTRHRGTDRLLQRPAPPHRRRRHPAPRARDQLLRSTSVPAGVRSSAEPGALHGQPQPVQLRDQLAHQPPCPQLPAQSPVTGPVIERRLPHRCPPGLTEQPVRPHRLAPGPTTGVFRPPALHFAHHAPTAFSDVPKTAAGSLTVSPRHRSQSQDRPR